MIEVHETPIETAAQERRTAFAGLAAAIAASAMLFASLASAVVVRRGISNDWTLVTLPPSVWIGTAVLLAGSAAIESGRRLAKRAGAPFARVWFGGVLLGLAFLGIQVSALGQLPAGVAAAFFRVLSGIYDFVALGALLGLAWAGVRASRQTRRSVPLDLIDVTAFYWHFVAVVWLSILALFHFRG